VAHVVNSVVLFGLGFLALYFLLPFLISRLQSGFFGSLHLLWNLARGNGTGLSWPSLRSSSLDLLRGGLPSVCGSIYLPFICSKRKSVNGYDVGKVARALHKEGESIFLNPFLSGFSRSRMRLKCRENAAAQNAQNIFESVISLGTGGVENGLYHTK
jgi:hypothetical protein